MAKDDEKDTGPGRELTWGEALEARVEALEAKVLKGGKDKAPKADGKDKAADGDKGADTKEEK